MKKVGVLGLARGGGKGSGAWDLPSTGINFL